MYFPSDIEKKLEFDKVREAVKAFCLGASGRRLVDFATFSDHFSIAETLLMQVSDMQTLYVQGMYIPLSEYADVEELFLNVKPKGAVPEKEELVEFKSFLQAAAVCLAFFSSEQLLPNTRLRSLSEGVLVDPHLLGESERIFDNQGNIADRASPELYKIRKELNTIRITLRRRTDALLSEIKKEGFATSDSDITIRNGRLVIPVAAEFKRRVKGLVHDESATGKTVFIEPAEIFDLNNRIRELEFEENREEYRIMGEFSDLLREHLPELHRVFEFIAQVDFIRAKSLWGLENKALIPVLKSEPLFHWLKAIHPVLAVSLRNRGRTIVPLDLHFSDKEHILVLSGPNAGGKSVCLKTAGLLQYMLQCGFPVPVAEGSECGFFTKIFLDLGDDQSLENDLSTYSSHLLSMKYFLEHADEHTLFLIDEFGSGTEPDAGAAVAESVLDILKEKKAYGIVTTHYTSLKSYAEHTLGVVNGSMRFDAEHLQPLFILDKGLPGNSFAFEIAKKIGLPERTIAGARALLGSEHIDLEKLLLQLQKEKKELEENLSTAAKEAAEAKYYKEEYQKLRRQIDSERSQILRKAKEEAASVLKEANRTIENTIRRIKETKADKAATQTVRNEMERFKTGLAEPEPSPKIDEEAYADIEENQPLQPGDAVRLKESGAVGEVIAIRKKGIEIAVGSIKTLVQPTGLWKISKSDLRKTVRSSSGSAANAISDKTVHFMSTIEVRGLRVPAALALVEKLTDEAVMLGVKEIRIVHGKGDGILRAAVREKLKEYRQIRSVEDEHVDRGGAGITVVYFKE